MEKGARGSDVGFREIADVDFFAHDRMSRFGEVDSDLVGATSFDATGDEGGRGELFLNADVGDRDSTKEFAFGRCLTFGGRSTKAFSGVAEET